MPKCEHAGCDAAAVVRITDSQELEPITDGDGQLWENRVPHSTHWFCAAHRREPIRYGRVPHTETEAEASTRLQSAALGSVPHDPG